MKLKDKIAIITGSGHGMGREMALAFAEEGANIVVAELSAPAAESVAKEIKALGRKALAIPTDVTSETDVNQMVQKTISEFGGIDVLLNNVGIGFGAHAGRVPLMALDLKVWRNVLDTNLTSQFLCAKAVLPRMIKQNSGSIINITSGLGKKGRPSLGAYCVSKFGVEGLTQVLAAEVKQFGIRSNALSPGAAVITESVLKLPYVDPGEPLLRPEVIRQAAVYLASDESAHINGQSISALVWNEQQGLGGYEKWKAIWKV